MNVIWLGITAGLIEFVWGDLHDSGHMSVICTIKYLMLSRRARHLCEEFLFVIFIFLLLLIN